MKRFIALSRFALRLVITEARKVKRFIFGLRFGLYRYVSERVDMTLREAVEAAKRHEYMKDDESKAIQPKTTQGGASQTTGGPSRDVSRGGSYQGNRGRGQNRSTRSGPSGNFSRKRDRDTYSQGSVA